MSERQVKRKVFEPLIALGISYQSPAIPVPKGGVDVVVAGMGCQESRYASSAPSSVAVVGS